METHTVCFEKKRLILLKKFSLFCKPIQGVRRKEIEKSKRERWLTANSEVRFQSKAKVTSFLHEADFVVVLGTEAAAVMVAVELVAHYYCCDCCYVASKTKRGQIEHKVLPFPQPHCPHGKHYWEDVDVDGVDDDGLESVIN